MSLLRLRFRRALIRHFQKDNAVLRHSWRSGARALGLAAAVALTLPALHAPAEASAPAVAASTAPITLWAPAQVNAYTYRGHAWTDLGLRVIAQDAPFELWSNRPS